MRYLLLLLLTAILLQAEPVAGQSGGYLYIESEPSRPFYLRTHDSLYSSAAGNYLILAPLRNMLGEIIVGFPGSTAALSFTLTDTISEKGLLLRDLKEEGWRLYDFNKNELVNVRRLGRQANELKGMSRRNDAFALRLSQVVNDSIILYYKPEGQSLAKREEKPNAVPVIVSAPVKPMPSRTTPGIRRLSQLDLGKKWVMEYEVVENGIADTVLIEIDKPVIGKKPGKGKRQVKGKKVVRVESIRISPGSQAELFSYYEQVFYRSLLPGDQLCRFSKAGECPYGTS